MQENYKDEWLDRAFQLAFFLHGERETAKRIAASAMNKLETASNAQFKRLYYTPTGRADNSKATRSRVSLNDLQLLQRLVLIESEIFERECEAAGKISQTSLLKFFVKHLVRISLKRNSFYVTLAVSRILHNYGTADAMEIYNVVVQDPERVHDDYYYRSRKGVLMKELKQRFGARLEIVKVNRGEERFDSQTDAGDLTETAKDALKFFTPWQSACSLPEKFDPLMDVIAPFHFDKDDPDAEHRIEINRIHAAIHPECFARLTNALDLPLPKEKMEIPKFMINAENHSDNNQQNWRNPPSLETNELQQIKDILTAQAESRKAMSAGFLRVAADGAEMANINLAETDAAKITLDESAELVEIYAGETLLAAHLLNFDDLQNGSQTQTVTLEGGQKITFEIAPVLDEFGEVSTINFAIRYAETVWRRRFLLAFKRAGFALGNSFSQPILKPALTFGLILLALTFGWLMLRNSNERKNNYAVAPTPNNQNGDVENIQNSPLPKQNEQLAEKENAPKILSPPDNLLPKSIEKNDGAENWQTVRKQTPREVEKDKILPKPKSEIKISPSELANNDFKPRRNETDKDGILRLPVRENNRRNPDLKRPEKEITVRGQHKKFSGKSLREIKFVYFEISGDLILGKQIASQIAAELGKSNRFQITGDGEKADAALKIYVRHESDGDAPEDASVAAVVRLVNAKGFVVYPNRRGVSGWKYVGTVAKLPRRIAADLLK